MYPESSPSATPRNREAATAQTITATAVRVPQITRESTSKPVTVVPSGWAADGGRWVPKASPSAAVSAKP